MRKQASDIMDRWVPVVHLAGLMVHTVHQEDPGDHMDQAADLAVQVMDLVAHGAHPAAVADPTAPADPVVDHTDPQDRRALSMCSQCITL